MLKVQCIHINKKLHANAAQLTSKGQHSCTSALQPLLLLLQLYQHSANVQTNRINAATNKEGFTEYSSCLNTINREHCWDHSYLTSTCVTFSPVPYVCNEGGCKDNFSLQLMFDLWPVAQLNNHLITRLPPGSSMLLAQGKHMTPHPWHKLSCNANAWSCASVISISASSSLSRLPALRRLKISASRDARFTSYSTYRVGIISCWQRPRALAYGNRSLNILGNIKPTVQIILYLLAKYCACAHLWCAQGVHTHAYAAHAWHHHAHANPDSRSYSRKNAAWSVHVHIYWTRI